MSHSLLVLCCLLLTVGWDYMLKSPLVLESKFYASSALKLAPISILSAIQHLPALDNRQNCTPHLLVINETNSRQLLTSSVLSDPGTPHLLLSNITQTHKSLSLSFLQPSSPTGLYLQVLGSEGLPHAYSRVKVHADKAHCI